MCVYLCVCVCVCDIYIYIYIKCSFRWPLWQFLKTGTLKIFNLLTVLGFCCYLRAFFFSPCCNEQGLHSGSSAQASRCGGFSFCGTWASLPHSMWNLPRPGIESVSPGRLNHWTTREIPGIDIFGRMLRGNQNAHHKSSDQAYQKVAYFLFFPKLTLHCHLLSWPLQSQ